MSLTAANNDPPMPEHRILAILLVSLTLVLVIGIGSRGTAAAVTTSPTVGSTELSAGWALRSANNVTDTGATISQVGYGTSGWYPVALPSTALAGLVANNVYQDIYFGTNLQSVPDLTTQNWWFRGEFIAAAITPSQVYWNPEAPDMNAGLWGKTFLDTTGPIALRDPYVKTVLPLPATNSADLTVYVDAINATNAPVTTTINGTITKSGYPSISFSQDVTLNANERREITFDPVAYPQLHVTSPALWWPYQFGSPELYQLAVSAASGGATSDTGSINFGIRQFTDYRTTVNGTSFVGYKVNGQNIFFRGGGYVWDMLQRWDTKTNAAHIQYVKDMGLNTIRLEGTVGNEELYDLADQAGIMLMSGFVCCSAWETDNRWTAEQEQVANASLNSQMRALRAHASPFLWTFGSDCPVTSAHLTTYKTTASTLHWQN